MTWLITLLRRAGQRLGIAVLLLGLTGAAQAQEPLRIFAAASLKTALDRIVQSWDGAAPGSIRVSYAGSGVLARQIVAGAPAHLFVSANPDWMGWAVQQGAIDPQSRRVIASNRLVLVAPAPAQPVALQAGTLAERLGPDGRLAIGLVASVPAGIYGAEALRALGLWPTLRDRLAQTDNVRAALALAALGEAPLALVYASDAAAEPRVDVVADVPVQLHAPIRYPAALVTPAPAHPKAAALLAYLTSDPAQTILQETGFLPPEPVK